jgi:uncharacterized membrane protein (UPF0136 family)
MKGALIVVGFLTLLVIGTIIGFYFNDPFMTLLCGFIYGAIYEGTREVLHERSN